MLIYYFIDVILPLPLSGLYTYRITKEDFDSIKQGIRVIVPFGKNKWISAIVCKIHHNPPIGKECKYIHQIIDTDPIISINQFRLWNWLSTYYMCSQGEVMQAALPSALKLSGTTSICIHPQFDGDISSLNEKEIEVIQLLMTYKQLTLNQISKTTKLQKIIPLISTLIEKQCIIIEEEIKDVYKAKKKTLLKIAENYQNIDAWQNLLKHYGKSQQTAKLLDLLLYFQVITKNNLNQAVEKSKITESKQFSNAQISNFIQKGIFQSIEKIESRLQKYEHLASAQDILLSPAQTHAFNEIQTLHKNKQTVLLHGVTGSGKTEIYIKYIQKFIEQKKQVLFLLPEIALTTQIVNRLRYYFGDMVGVYHSRFSEFEKVEIWNRVLNFQKQPSSQYQIILGARSAILLPFSNLGLIIVDEEHDSSYKQNDPAPRYHARDAAAILASIHNAKLLLGSATPSVESYYNSKLNKYGLVSLSERYANSVLPEILTVDIKDAYRKKEMTSIFSHFLLKHIKEALDKKEQIILFQNRRGFSIRLECDFCGWIPKCKHCDVSLTYHKKTNLLKCHYCGYSISPMNICEECGSSQLKLKGFGTEKINEELELLFPNAKIARMDLDTTRSKNSYQNMIQNFTNGKIDILIGTQMVTKGLDFKNVSLVGILNADNLISFPDFRAFERSFQIMSQVSGRAGRSQNKGKVIIQTYNPYHASIRYVMDNDYSSMFTSQIQERKILKYPPCYRLIKISVKHNDEETVNQAALLLATQIRKNLPHTILGPEFPLVAKIKNQFIKDIWIKVDGKMNLPDTKIVLQNVINILKKTAKFSTIRIAVNVDPY